MPSKKKKESKSNTETKVKTAKKSIISNLTRKQIALAIVLVIAGSLYLFRSLFFVAFVNGTPITRVEFTKELEKSIGQQTLDNLVTQKLILQEAGKKGVTVSSEDINKEINAISEQIESQGISLDQALASQGQTRKDLEESIHIQKAIEKILGDKIAITEEELMEYYEKNSGMYGADANFEELKENISQQVRAEKMSSEFGTWLDNLKSEANIIYFMTFSPR
jgi:parvulin-like peptidyl-prolyl isomerase